MEESPKRQWSPGEHEAAVILFSILVIASAVLGLLVYESTVPFCGGAPCPAHELLNLVSTNVNSPTNVTLSIINTGSVAVSLASYYVKDANGQTYAGSNWSGPNIPPNHILNQHNHRRESLHLPNWLFLRSNRCHRSKQPVHVHNRRLAQPRLVKRSVRN